MPAQSPPSLDELLRVLTAATERQTLHWTKTAEEDSFRADLGPAMVRISKVPTPSRYVLSVFDMEGILLDEYHPKGEGEQSVIETLYKNIRSRVLNLDWKLKGVYDQLKKLAGET